MNAYCVIIPSAMNFALNSVLSKRTKLNFRKFNYVYVMHRRQDREMGAAFGGLIDQSEKRDPGTHKWIPMQKKPFNVQIPNTPNFQQVTEFPPSQPSIGVTT